MNDKSHRCCKFETRKARIVIRFSYSLAVQDRIIRYHPIKSGIVAIEGSNKKEDFIIQTVNRTLLGDSLE